MNAEKLRSNVCFTVAVCLFLSIWGSVTAWAGEFGDVPVKGMVTMVDLGAKKCIPCKMMAPIMEKMEKVYKGKAVVVFIDVWENPKQAKRFKIRSIPTQIFFNEKREEMYRHVGFMSEAAIKTQLKKMGVSLPKTKDGKEG